MTSRWKRLRKIAEGKRAAKTGELPPGYVALIQRMCDLMLKWLTTEPGLVDLRWHDPKGTLFVAPLRGKALDYLAASPDAKRLLEWLDEQTGQEGTLAQATMALRLIGHLPSGPAEVVHESEGLRTLRAFACRTGTDTDVPPSPCGHCGHVNEFASGQLGQVPRPGDFSVCASCGGVNSFRADLSTKAVRDEDIPAQVRAQLSEMRDQIRQARLQLVMKRRPGRAEA